MTIKEIKLFDRKDYDYYNPKPYITHLVSFCNTDAQNRVAYDIDSSEYDYLFAYVSKEDEERQMKKRRVFRQGFIDLIKLDDIDRVIRALENAVSNYASKIKDEIETQQRRIKDTENVIKNATESLAEQRLKLKELEDVVQKHTNPSGTPELPF